MRYSRPIVTRPLEKSMRRLLAFVLLSPFAAMADDAANAPPTLWAGNLAGGYIRTAGTNNTTAANLKGELDYTNLPWANELTAAMATGRTGSTSSAEQYDFGNKVKFSFNDVDYAFGDVAYDNNRFSGVVENYSETVGYGRRLLMLEKQTLDAELGVGASQQREAGQDNFKLQFIGTVGGKYTYTFSPTSQFVQTLRTEIGTRNTLVNPVTSLKLTIVGSLFATLSYDLRYNTTVPDGTPHTDQIESIGFGYSFGKKS
jgi:putative salt-induced outer membrane protein